MKNRVLTIAAVLMCTATIASAQGNEGQRRPHPRGDGAPKPGAQAQDQMFEGITLTDEQKAKIQTIREKYKAKFEELGKAAMEAKAKGANDSASRQQALAANKAMREQQQEQHKEIEAVLTPEQRERYNKNKGEMENKLKERLKGGMRMGGFGGGQGGGTPQGNPQ